MLTMIFAFSWITICLVVVGLTMKGEYALIRDRIETLRLSLDQDVQAITPELTEPFAQRVVMPCLERIARLFSNIMPINKTTMSAKLERAGNPWKLQVMHFMGLKVASVLLIGGVGFAAALLLGDAANRALAVVCGLVIGYALPDTLLEQTIRNRHKQIRKSLAPCLDLLVVSAEAGLGFDGALSRLVEKVKGPLPDEFRRVLNDMSVGRTRIEALRMMSQRVGLPELTSFVAAIHQADALGVSIAHVLRVQAQSVREQRNLRARTEAAKLPVKILFPLVFCIFPAIFIVLLVPGAVEIYKALSGAVR